MSQITDDQSNAYSVIAPLMSQVNEALRLHPTQGTWFTYRHGQWRTRATTQFFFETETFLRFRERAARAGIAAPLVPGILPVSNFGQVVRFSRMCGTAVPAWLTDLFDGLDEEPETRKLVAAMVATEQCRALAAEGVDQFHFYTLNGADLTLGICRRLGLKPAPVAALAGGLAAETPPMAVDPAMG